MSKGFMMKRAQRKKEDSQDITNEESECPSNTDIAVGNADAVVAQPPGREDRVRLCVDIISQQHRKLKVYAAQHGITLNELVERLADRLLP